MPKKWPSSFENQKLWMQRLGMIETNYIGKYQFICSNHFSSDDFILKNWDPRFRRYLKTDATPRSMGQITNSQSPLSSRSSDKILTLSESEIYQKPVKDGPAERNTTPASTGSEIEQIPFDSPLQLKRKRKIDEEEMESIVQKKLNLDSSAILSCSSSETITVSGASSLTLTASEAINAVSQQAKLEDEQMVDLDKPLSIESIDKPSKAKNRLTFKRYVGDLADEDFSSPRRAKKNWAITRNAVTFLRRKVKNLQQANNRYKSRIHSFKTLLAYLKEKDYISLGAQHNLQESLADSSKLLVTRLLQGPRKQKYNPELRSFAMTLHFYSPKAYQYVRQKFNKTLPHPITISKWYSKVDGKPGFTALSALKVKADEAKTKNFDIVCSLVLDEVSIRKQVEWDGRKYYGFIDVGTKMESDSISEASEALVLMVVALNTTWKIPIGYFLINGLTRSEKASITIKALEFLSQADITVCSITCDGAPSNFVMASCLGADYSNHQDLKSYFLHPVNNNKIYFIMDPSHMLKLVRNCFGSYSVLQNGAGKEICWQYLNHLLHVQSKEGLSAANKFKKRHLQYWREKIKVKLATQTLSKSVADALGFLREDVGDAEIKNKFIGSEATEEFLMIFNDCFDIMNSSSLYATYKYKRAISPKTVDYIFKRLLEIKMYILDLKYAGKPILKSLRKCGFLGMLINIESILNLYKELVEGNLPKLKYLLVYKLSQDHLEIFFSAIRRRGGDNNNPTAKQFQSAYKKLLIHIEVKGADTGNATAIDSTSILHYSSASRKITEAQNGDDLLLSDDHTDIEQTIGELDFINSSAWHLTTYSADVVKYISGYVGRSLTKCLSCGECVDLITGTDTSSLLQKRKTYEQAKMFSSSKILFDICTLGEKHYRVISNAIGIFSNTIENLIETLIKVTFRNLPSNIMNLFGRHVLDCQPLSTHFIDLIKLILKKYFNIKIHHEIKKRLDENVGTKVRSMLTKTITFKHQ